MFYRRRWFGRFVRFCRFRVGLESFAEPAAEDRPGPAHQRRESVAGRDKRRPLERGLADSFSWTGRIRLWLMSLSPSTRKSPAPQPSDSAPASLAPLRL